MPGGQEGRPPLAPRLHRVRESLQTRMAKLACSCFLSLLFVVGLILFILWLSLRPHRPRFHVVSFSFPAIANNVSTATDVTFQVSDRNPNGHIGIYYDTTMEGRLFYHNRKLAVTPLLLPFYQPPKNTTMVHGVFRVAPSPGIRDELVLDSADGHVAFRLDLKVIIRFRVTTWETHRHGLHVSCDVAVGPDGSFLPQVPNKRCILYFD